MKAYILKPSKIWSYCGGGLVILAESFEEAKKFVSSKNLHESEDEAEKFAKENNQNYDNWTLVATLECPYEEESRLVLLDENWA